MLIHTPEPRPSHVIIYAGGELGDSMLTLLETADYVIGADRGALYLIQHRIQPDLAVGDFDSVQENERIWIREQSRQYIDFDAVDKDYTDTELAFNIALEWLPEQITLCGVTGTRLDHTLANIHLLRKALDAGVACRIVDDHNLIMITNSALTLTRQPFPYISLLPLSSVVTGITLEGFAYPLTNATLTIGQSLGISNEFVNEEVTITVTDGYLLVMCSRD